MTFWQSIKNGFNNGNIAKWTQVAGQTAFTIGATGALIHGMNNSCNCQNSIFGGGCFGGNNMNMFGGGFNMFGCGGGNWFSPANPYVNPMGIGFPNYQNQMNMLNVQYGNQLAYNWGWQKGMEARLAAQQQQLAQLQQQSPQFLPKTNNKYAGDISKDQSTELGKSYDEKAKEMVDEKGKAVSGKSFDIVKGGIKNIGEKGSEERKEAFKQYKEAVTELGKSYLAEMDGTSGDGNGQVTQEEFVEHSLRDLSSKATSDKKQTAKLQAQIAFNRIDQNGDGKLDYKELGAVFATLDGDNNGDNKSNFDGVITSEEFEENSKGLYEFENTKFEKLLRKNYNDLYNQKSDK